MQKLHLMIGVWFWITVLGATGTMQDGDYIEYESRLYRFGEYGTTPLTEYFRLTKKQPPKQFESERSSLRRGHVGHWRVHDKKLWLIAIYVPDPVTDADTNTPMKNLCIFPIQKVFPNTGPAVVADWFSGELRVRADAVENFISARPIDDWAPRILRFEKGILVGVAPWTGEQAAPGQPATRPESKPEGDQKPQPKSEGRSR